MKFFCPAPAGRAENGGGTMDLNGVLNVWGGGQLLTFSGLDGSTDYERGLLLRSSASMAGFEVKLPEAGGVVAADFAPPAEAFLSGDCFTLKTRSGAVVRGVMVDAHHLLVTGPAGVWGLSGAVRAERRGERTLLGVRKEFRPELIDSDFERIFAARLSWLSRLPVPAGIGEDSRRALAKAAAMMKNQVYSPEGKIHTFWSTPDRWPHRRMWIWDSVFHALGMRHFDVKLARDYITALFDAQQPDGFIPHMMSPEYSSQVTQPPVIATGIAGVEETESDPEWVGSLYPKLKAFLLWIFAHRDTDGAGLVEWAIEANESCRCGESGMDNSPRFDGAIQLDAPDFNAYLARECELMAGFAARCAPEEVAGWQERHCRLNRLMNERLWSPELEIYVDYDVIGNRRCEVASSAGFLPLISGAASPEQAAKLAAQLSDPKRFGTPLGVPSISRSSEKSYRKDMWRGPVWININYLIGQGLRRYGHVAEADALWNATLREEEKFYLKYGTFFEFYDDRRECDPPRLLRKQKLAPDESPYHQVFFDYGWSATLYCDMLFQMNR